MPWPRGGPGPRSRGWDCWRPEPSRHRPGAHSKGVSDAEKGGKTRTTGARNDKELTFLNTRNVGLVSTPSQFSLDLIQRIWDSLDSVH